MLKVAKVFSGLVFVLILVCLGTLNQQLINIVLVPELLISGRGGNFEVPLFSVITVAIFLGFVVGSFWEHSRSKKIRKSLKEKSKSLNKSNMKIKDMEKKFGVEDDEVFSLLN
mgnify:CR=1 FL=1